MLRMLSQEGFRLALKNKTVQNTDKDGNTKRAQLADVYLTSHNRGQYLGGIAMLPNLPVPEGVYNLYQGLGVEPASGNATPALKHHPQGYL